MTSPIRAPEFRLSVVKVGGSLLDFPDLPRALTEWLAAQQTARVVLLVGGGPFVDIVRRADRLFAMGEEVSHHLALATMQITAQMLTAIVPNAQLASHCRDLDGIWQQAAVPIVEPLTMLAELQSDLREVPELPHSWAVTSDSIAAALAAWLGADELVLLKSSLPDEQEPALASAAGYVDGEFAAAAIDVPRIRYVNLRDPAYPERIWLSPDA